MQEYSLGTALNNSRQVDTTTGFRAVVDVHRKPLSTNERLESIENKLDELIKLYEQSNSTTL